MSGIAEVLLNLGYPVSGSDLKGSGVTRRLKKRGAAIRIGHRRENLDSAEVVVVSSAVRKGNPEVMAAEERKIPIIQRAEMLAELMRFSKFGVAVAGTHGKTTTTSLVASVLYNGGCDPTMIIGGRVNSFKSNARLGRGDFMVAEADESDGSFLKLSPTIAVITGIDREHMDFYSDFNRVQEAFLQFARKVPFYGAVICCRDHPVVRQLIPKIDKRVVTYGLAEGADFEAKNILRQKGHTSYDLCVYGKKIGGIELNLMGRHNVLNSLAAIAVAFELDIPFKKIHQALKSFSGIERRCQVLLKNGSITVLDDYGHHPEEIKVTLEAIREAYPGRRLVTLFQPHRYTRTKDLFDDFTQAFDRVDCLMVTDIYPASEEPIAGVSAQSLAEAIRRKKGGEVVYLPKDKKIADEIVKAIQPGDLFVSLGAGDVTKIGKECARRLKGFGTRQ